MASRLIDPLDGLLARARATASTAWSLPQTPEEWRDWRPRTVARLKEALGTWPERVPLAAEETDRHDEGDHWRVRVLYDSDAFSTVPAWLLLPKDIPTGERRPALLCAHGHGRGKDDPAGVVDPTLSAEERQRQEANISVHNYDYARQFVRHGYVCLVPDWRGFGERRPPADWIRSRRDPCNVLYLAYGYFGFQLLALDLWDGMRGIDYLQSRPEVDPARLGCVGLSFGGTMTTYLTALDERIKAADIVCYLSTVRDDALGHRGLGNFCGSQFLRELLTFGDISTIASLIAPRPLLVEIGQRDDCFVVDDALRCYREVEQTYSAAGAGDRLSRDVFDGPHAFGGRLAFDFFARWLGQPIAAGSTATPA
jgi:dienelactone hydrolase